MIKLSKRYIKLIPIMLFTLLFTLTSFTITVKASIVKPTLSESTSYLTVGEKQELKVKNNIAGATYTFHSLNRKIATVTKEGIINGKSVGKVTIECRLKKGTTTYTCQNTTYVVDKNSIYTVKKNSVPADTTMLRYSTYNNKTKDYYVLRSYLELCEKAGGGTILVKKGIYVISNVLCVPSNTTIQFEDGVTLIKGLETGTSKFKASNSLFQFVKPSKMDAIGYYSGYEGEKNIKLIGNGTVRIDLRSQYAGVGIIMGHNQNVEIKGIMFQNSNYGHFIELDASRDVLIDACTFEEAIQSPKVNKEAINLDTPDALTGGFSCKWTSFDKTPNDHITIQNCTFRNVDVGVGTHKYSQNQDVNGNYTVNMEHTNLIFRGNRFYQMRAFGLAMLNWNGVLVEGNTFEYGGYHLADGSYQGAEAFAGYAVTDLTFRKNTIRQLGAAGFIKEKATNQRAASVYTDITSHLTEDNQKSFYDNIFELSNSESASGVAIIAYQGSYDWSADISYHYVGRKQELWVY